MLTFGWIKSQIQLSVRWWCLQTRGICRRSGSWWYQRKKQTRRWEDLPPELRQEHIRAHIYRIISAALELPKRSEAFIIGKHLEQPGLWRDERASTWAIWRKDKDVTKKPTMPVAELLCAEGRTFPMVHHHRLTKTSACGPACGKKNVLLFPGTLLNEGLITFKVHQGEQQGCSHKDEERSKARERFSSC